jgi:gliding motility-associated-like protein
LKKIATCLPLLFLLLLSFRGSAQHSHSQAPIEYIENQGQWDAPFYYRGVTPRGDIFLRKDGFRVLLSDDQNHDKVHGVRHGWIQGPQTLKYHAFDIQFIGAQSEVSLMGEKPQKHYYNYFLGKDQQRWKSGIHPVMAVNYAGLYPGIDAHVYSEDANIKYDIILHPGADINQVKLQYNGLDKLALQDGKLVMSTSLGDITESIPFSYQYVDGIRKEVKCKFVLRDGQVSFDIVKGYDARYDLYIDPTLVFCTFTGSAADNWGFTATNDTLGNFYAGGIVSGLGYPVTVGAFQQVYGGGTTVTGSLFPCDVGISKFNASGNTLLFATYLGGSDNEQPQSIIVDNNQNLCIAGRTYSANFPTTAGCYDPSYNGGGDMFVTKMNSTGTTLIGSTYVGGTLEDAANEEAQEFLAGTLKHNYGDDARSEIIYDANNNVYIAACTKSTDFPVINAFQNTLSGGQDGVIVELNDNLSNLIWSTFAGGSANDAAYVLSLNKTNPNELFVGGGTMSSNFPTTAGALHSTYQGGLTDGFVMKFNTTTKALMAGTYIGTNAYDQVYGVQTDDSNHLYIMGQTFGAYPVTAGVYSNPNSSQFISKLDVNLSSILISTVFGTGTTAQANISPNAFLVDKCQNVYVSGWGGAIGGPFISSTTGLPTMNPLQGTTDGNDFYFIVFNKNLLSLLYASFFGQNGGISEHVDGGTSRFDKNGVIYQAICAACGASTIFPTTAGSYSPNNPSPNCNLAALKIAFDLQNPDADAQALGATIGCTPFTVQFQNNSTSSVNYTWDFGDGSPTTNAVSPSHTYTTAGTFTVKLYASNPNGCTFSLDSFLMVITVKNDSIHADFNVVKVDSCGPYTANFNNISTNTSATSSPTYIWNFGDGSPTFTGATPPLHNYPAGSAYTVTLTMTDTNACNSPSVITKIVNFNANFVVAAFDMPDSVCMPATINFIDQSVNASTYNWNFGDGNTSTASNPTNTFVAPGTYTVTLYTLNPNTCNKIDSIKHTIVVFASPVAAFTWAPNPPQPNTPNIFTNNTTGATSYLWNFGDGTTSTNKDEIHIYNKDGYYDVCLTATNDAGCIDTACQRVRGMVVPLVDVPSGFSPNGDGVNDIVYVKGYGIESMVFRIFNRWGEKVFESTQQSLGWDGRYKGVMQEMEAYGYTLTVHFFDGTSDFKSGNITLLK